MYSSYPRKFETDRALREVIVSIVETNINEDIHVELYNQFVEKVIASFQKKVYFSNGVYVELLNDLIIVRVFVNVYQNCSMVNELIKLQERIYLDVYELTGFKLTAINIIVKNLIMDETKKTQ